MKLLRLEEVIERTGLSRTTIWRLEKKEDGEFPSRRKIGDSAVGWLESDINEWIENRPKVNQIDQDPEK